MSAGKSSNKQLVFEQWLLLMVDVNKQFMDFVMVCKGIHHYYAYKPDEGELTCPSSYFRHHQPANHDTPKFRGSLYRFLTRHEASKIVVTGQGKDMRLIRSELSRKFVLR